MHQFIVAIKKFPPKSGQKSQTTATPTKPTRTEPGLNPDKPGFNPDYPGFNPDKAGRNPDYPGLNPDKLDLELAEEMEFINLRFEIGQVCLNVGACPIRLVICFELLRGVSHTGVVWEWSWMGAPRG